MSHTTAGVWRRQLNGSSGDLARRAGVLFMIGSFCFGLGAFPVYFMNVSASVVGVTFFVGSLFFTSAGITQWTQTKRDDVGGRLWQPDSTGWWATVVQFVGMLFFNINTFRAAFVSVPSGEVNELIWAPDFYGSIAFLIASHLSWWVVCGRLWCVQRDSADWWMAALNYLGSIFFMASAIASFTLPTTGEVVNIAITNAGTFFGAVGFFLGGYLLLPARPERLNAG